MATFHLSGATTVADLCEQFNTAFGSQLKIYNANKVADPSAKLSEVGLKEDVETSYYANLTVGSFISRMKEEHGLKVKVYTCDEWVACLDGLTLESSGKVKKKAVKADMESMIAYQRTETSQPSSSNNNVAEKKCNDGALNGLFSVSPNKKIRFSMGNLQFNAKKYEFRFADHQWDIIGRDNEKVSPNYDGWIDLFGYGTSGYMGCQPYEIGGEDKYPSQDIANTKYDWGIYNPIVNGGNKTGLWRTLTKDEWEYLFKLRPNAEKLHARACVNSINGAIILPDDFYEHRIGIPFDYTPEDYNGNQYNTTQWSTFENAGAIFLPHSDYRCRDRMFSSDDWPYQSRYWTSNSKQEGNTSYCTQAFTTNHWYRYLGLYVRLVQDVK